MSHAAIEPDSLIGRMNRVVFDDDDDRPWMGRLTGLETDLSELLGRPVDVVPRPLLEWVIRDRVLAEARPIYVATR